MPWNHMGKIFYIMGKSASGKDHIYARLMQHTELNLKKMVLYTTRPIRDGEEEGKQYFFTDEEKLKAGIHGDAVSYVFTASVENVHTTTTVAFRGNGLEGTGEGYTLYAYSSDGNFKKVNDENWSFVFDGETLSTSDIYEIHIPIDDNSIYDIDEAENNIRVSVVLISENQ